MKGGLTANLWNEGGIMEKIMAVWDVDAGYARRFADVVNQKEKVPFTVVPFTSLENLREYAKEHAVEILLVSGAVPQQQLKEIGAGTVLTLAEGEIVSSAGSYPSVYKYQSTDGVIREVMSHYCEMPRPVMVAVGKRAKIIGIYSPVSRCLKTSLALTMGQQLARDEKVLYVDFEVFSGFVSLLGGDGKGDLSDVLYFFRQESLSVLRLKSMLYDWKDMDYIPPVRYPEDLEQLTGEEAARLVERLASDCGYDYVIVDLGQMICNMIPVLETCDIVYMPVKEDGVSCAKLEEFDQYLDVSHRESLRERIVRVKLPWHNSFGRKDDYMEQLLWGELGDYVRNLLKGVPWR